MLLERRLLHEGPWSHASTQNAASSSTRAPARTRSPRTWPFRLKTNLGVVVCHVLPGTVLAHGFQSTAGVALLWQVWLLSGPLTVDLEHFLEDCRPITTDMGVERLIVSASVFQISSARLALSVSAHCRSMTRLLPLCVEQPNWHHFLGGCLKAALRCRIGVDFENHA